MTECLPEMSLCVPRGSQVAKLVFASRLLGGILLAAEGSQSRLNREEYIVFHVFEWSGGPRKGVFDIQLSLRKRLSRMHPFTKLASVY